MDKDQSYQEALARGTAFEEIIRSKGWEYLNAYIQNQIKLFASDVLLGTIKDWETLVERRGEVNGLRKLIGLIDTSLDTLKDERRKQSDGLQPPTDSGQDL